MQAEPRPEPSPVAEARLRGALTRLRTTLAAASVFLLRWLLRLGLPLLGAAAMLQALPYRATVAGIPFVVRGTLFSDPGLSADTTLGSWQFPDLTALPIGVHVRPENVDVLQLARAANGNLPAFIDSLRAQFADQVPMVAGWLLGEFLLGLLLGLGAAATINLAVRQLRGLPPRRQEWRHRARQFAAALVVVVLAAGFGRLTYNPDWVRQSRLTGTLAAAQLFPDQLSQYYSTNSKAFDVLGSVIGIQAALQQRIEAKKTPDTALRIMFISDMHLAATYPLVAQYVTSYGVDLIVDTGDETEFGTANELTPHYLDGLRAITATTPMIWLAGNHDSPAVQAVMRTVPGVRVLGSKTPSANGYSVSAGELDAYGLTIAGLPDPRVYGGPGPYGSDAPDVVGPLERLAVHQALGLERSSAASAAPASDPPTPAASLPSGRPTAGQGPTGSQPRDPVFDIFATHEPIAADELRTKLPGLIRQTDSGHVHKQNATGDIQDGDGNLDLVEGSTGAGGLDNIVRGTDRPPIEFSIESVSSTCQFTRVIRFQIDSAAGAAGRQVTAQAYGDDVTASTIYFKPQDIAAGRTCGTLLGISPERPLSQP